MYQIYKITSNTVVDFAAEELKKYLRMWIILIKIMIYVEGGL